MSRPSDRLLDEALLLPESERRVLGLRLLESVRGVPGSEIERAWVAEAKQRLDDIRSGRAQPAPWEEACGRIFARG